MDYLANLIFSINVVMPIMSVMGVGYVVRRLDIIGDKTVSQCNNLAFKVFLPALLFNNVRRTTVDEITNPSLFLFVLVAVLLSFLVVTLVIMALEKDNRKRAVMIQGICRSNYALFGLPLISLLKPGEDLAIASLLVAVVIPVYNILSVVVFSVFCAKKFNVKDMLLSIVKNPLIIATALGGVLMFADITLPPLLDNSFEYLGVIASPFALFMLGARFSFNEAKTLGRQLVITCLGRLVILPTVIMTVAIALGFRSMELACLMVLFYAPTAASSYVMAQAMGGDGDLASSVVVVTTLFCILSMFVVIFIYNGLGLI